MPYFKKSGIQNKVKDQNGATLATPIASPPADQNGAALATLVASPLADQNGAAVATLMASPPVDQNGAAIATPISPPADQNDTTDTVDIKDKLINWFVLAIGMALIPMASRFAMSYYMGQGPITIPDLLFHGELFLICVAVSAGAVGELALKRKTTGRYALSFYTNIGIIALCLCFYANIGSNGVAVSARTGFAWFSSIWFIITLIAACSCKVLAEK